MNISQRTLQTYRDTGKISFSRINHKTYYKVSDIEILLKQKSKCIIINNYGGVNYKTEQRGCYIL